MKAIINTNPGTREFTQIRLSSLLSEGIYPFSLILFLHRVVWYLDNKGCFPDCIVANDNGIEFVYFGEERNFYCLFHNDKTIRTYYKVSNKTDDDVRASYGGGSAKEIAKAISKCVECL